MVPTVPKKLSRSCAEFINLCFARGNSEVSAKGLLAHTFIVSDILNTSAVESRQSTENKNSVLSNSQINPSQIQGKRLINMLNSVEDNPMFTVSISIASPHSQMHSINTTTNQNVFNVLHNENKRILTENILEELDTSKENSPGILKEGSHKRYFEFSDIDEPIQETQKSEPIEESLKYNVHKTIELSSVPANNFDTVNFYNIKISKIPARESNNLTASKNKELQNIDQKYSNFLSKQPFTQAARKRTHSIDDISIFHKRTSYPRNKHNRYSKSDYICNILEDLEFDEKKHHAKTRFLDDFDVNNFLEMQD